MILVFFEVADQLQIDQYIGPNTSIFNKNGFIEVKDGNQLLASYNPLKFICAKKIRQQDIEMALAAARAKSVPDPAGAEKTAEGEPKVAENDNAEPVHPGGGTENGQTPAGG